MAWANTHCIDLERGSTQYLSVANTAGVFDLTTGTIEMHLKVESFQAGTERPPIISTQGANAGFILRFNRDDLDHTIEFYINEANQAASTTALVAGTWYHVAVTWDTSERNIYINGTLENTNSVDATLAAGAATMLIGKAVGSAEYYDGLIDDIRIWNTKRTGVQILANMYNDLVGDETGLLSLWKLDNALTDSTSGARTLTNNGAAVFSTAIQPFSPYTNSETSGIPTEALSFTTTQPITVSDTVGAPTESVRIGYGFQNTTKNNSTFTNTTKS